jgi:hypothetical protein
MASKMRSVSRSLCVGGLHARQVLVKILVQVLGRHGTEHGTCRHRGITLDFPLRLLAVIRHRCGNPHVELEIGRGTTGGLCPFGDIVQRVLHQSGFRANLKQHTVGHAASCRDLGPELAMINGTGEVDQGIWISLPSYSTVSPLSNARITPSFSSNTARRSGFRPRLCTALSPTPIPQIARPSDSSCKVAQLLASTAG